MGTIAKAGQAMTQFKPAPQGNHVACCVGVYDMGHQESTWEGKTSWKPQVLIQWELSDEAMDDGRPFTLSRKFNLTLHENAALRKFLQAWRGKTFTEQEARGFDVKELLGVPCMLAVVHNPGSDGRIWANVDAATPLPKRINAPESINPLRYYSTDDGPPGPDVPERIAARILQSQEFQGTAVGDLPRSEGPPQDHDSDEAPF